MRKLQLKLIAIIGCTVSRVERSGVFFGKIHASNRGSGQQQRLHATTEDKADDAGMKGTEQTNKEERK